MRLTLALILSISFINGASGSSYPSNVGLLCSDSKGSDVAGYWFVGMSVEMHRVLGSQIVHYHTGDVTLKGANHLYFHDSKNPGEFQVLVDRKNLTIGRTWKRQCQLAKS